MRSIEYKQNDLIILKLKTKLNKYINNVIVYIDVT